jgi:hypothetical protein
MTVLLVILTRFLLNATFIHTSLDGETCSVARWLSNHPSDSALALVLADSLDDTLRSQGPKGPLTPPPLVTLRGIGGEVVLGTVIDSLGNVISTDPLRVRITRWQAGVSPDEIRRWTPQFDTAAVMYVRNRRYALPRRKGRAVYAFLCVTVRYEPIPVGNRFNVAVSARP